MMHSLLKKVFLAAICCCCLGLPNLYAQTSPEEISANLSNDPRVADFKMDTARGTPSFIKMNDSGEMLALGETTTFLQSVLGYGSETSFVDEGTTLSEGLQIDKFQQYTNGVKVEHGLFKAISRKGYVLSFTAEYYSLPASIKSTPALSEEAALQAALDHVGATTYSWEYVDSLGDSPEITEAYNELYPTGELVFVDNYQTIEVDLTLAYKFNVYAAEPLSRADIYVDAASGKILLVDAIIKHADGHSKEDIKKEIKPVQPLVFTSAVGDTRYAGTRNFDTSQDVNGYWVLNGVTPTGVENETLSFEGAGGLPLSIPALAMLAEPIADGDGDLTHPETADNVWNASEHRKDNFSATNPYPVANERNNDDVALDAHWGAEVVLNYWQNVHNRNSYDDKGTKVLNFVHYGDAYDNAFWNGSSMTYGDGSYQGGTNPGGMFAPLTSMDVCSHEIAHGVCEYTANLVYQRESGAMNEGFSDIWAAAVEAYVVSEIDGSLQYDPWGIGEQIDERDGGLQPGDPQAQALRWMDDPKAAGDPDSYGGENWINPNCGEPTLANDYCGVHTNSGVLNKWYYFLVTGNGQSFSPGSNKQSADDGVTDSGNIYSVEGLGFTTASSITYLAETMLFPNATFADMREASILSAQLLYGIGSNEEQQTTNAWHAVDVGDAYSAGVPNTIAFSESNHLILSEKNTVNGCLDYNEYEVLVSGVELTSSATINISVANSTAIEGKDYDISTKTLSFTGTESKSLTITVYDDALLEDAETIVLSFVYDNNFEKQEFSISDNDFAPRTGVSSIDLLPTETFSVDGVPTGWSIVNLLDGVNIWKINGDLTAEGKAYVTDGTAEIPIYNQLSYSNTILRTPLINAAAANNVTVSFDWEVGGETDVDPTILYDYGEFVYSVDGTNYISVKTFVGNALGVTPSNGNFSAIINELDGKAFFLGWRWYNDALVGTEFSFTVDNIKVSATPAGVETQAGEKATATVNAGTAIYFMSETDQALIAKVENATEDLGCVTLSVINEGTSFNVFPNISTARPSKVFSIAVENQDASYDLTLYFTDEELSAFDATAGLIPIKVNSSNIDDADDRARNFQLNGALTDVKDQYHAYTGTFKGSGTASVAEDFTYCADAPSPWISADIGSVGKAGAICYMDGTFEMDASGSGIGGKEDSFYFTYQTLDGDGEIIAQVNGLENTNTEAKAAVMIRGSLAAGSAFAMTSVVSNPDNAGNAVQFEYRKSAGSAAHATGYTAASIPQYIRLVRSGSLVEAYTSEVNGSWQLIGSLKISFGTTLYVGLAATSDLDGTSSVAEFNDVSVTSSASGQTTARTAGSDMNNAMDSDVDSSKDEEPSAFAVYPNPARNIVNLEMRDSKIKTVIVYDHLGNEMKWLEFSTSSNRVEINVSDLSKGLYLMTIFAEDGKRTENKFFKE